MRLFEILPTPAAMLRSAVAQRGAETTDEERRELLEALAAAAQPVPMYLLRHALR